MSKIVILTGAGISAESGLGTFRDADGLWTKYPLEDVATPEGFARDPALVQEFYNLRRADAAKAQPNAAHKALARLQDAYSGEIVIVTQNVDGLHEAAGSRGVIHMHGQLDQALCGACGHRWPAPTSMAVGETCPDCQGPHGRPDVVWFGEIPYHMDLIFTHLATADVFASIGTSGQVYPAAGFVQEAGLHGAHTVELNLDTSDVSSAFAERWQGAATEIVPDWVAAVLKA
jgi:NAD-dependent deacetylase